MIYIRPMEQTDELMIVDLIGECWRLLFEQNMITNKQLARLIEERCQPDKVWKYLRQYECFIAGNKGEVVGMLAFGKNVIEELWVHPMDQRQGIGTMLFKHAENKITKVGYSTLSVATTAYGKPFYEAMGMEFSEKRIITFGPLEGCELLVLEKRL